MVIERFPSSSSSAVYECNADGDGGVASCTCPGWKFSKKMPKQCKHLTRLVGRGILHADMRLVDGHAPGAPTPVAVAMAATPQIAAGAPQAMLAHQIEKAPREPWGDADWEMELKYDGHRLFVTVGEDGLTTQHARSGNIHDNAWLRQLPLPPGTILDGEIVAPGDKSAYATGSRKDLVYVVFDALQIGQMDLRAQAWFIRRQAMAMALGSLDGLNIEASKVFGTPDQERADTLIAEGAEGVMLKRRAAPYQEGKRSWDLLKYKMNTTYDLVIVDMDGVPTSEERKALGWKNLRYGLYFSGELKVIGSLGVTGPAEKLEPYIGKVVEVKGYGQSPTTGAIRHPVFIRVRDDKLPEECTI